jgi:uncharacterized membrane protein YheB (UPF0754 family)
MSPLIEPDRIHVSFFKQLWEALKKATLNQFPSELSNKTNPPFTASRAQSTPLTLQLGILKSVPYVLVAMFILSFWWDFPTQSIQVFTLHLPFKGLLRTLAVSGLIGFGTNWLAVTMLFKPIHKRPLLGQGLIPSQKPKLASRLAHTIANDLVSVALIQEKIKETKIIETYTLKSLALVEGVTQDPTFRSELKSVLTAYLNALFLDDQRRSHMAIVIMEALQESIKEKKLEHLALQTYLFVRGKEAHEIIEKAISGIPSRLDHLFDKLDQELDRWPAYLKQESVTIESLLTTMVAMLLNKLEIREFIEDNLNRYDEQRFEKMIKNATNDQLIYIQYLGGILGVIGGLVIWSPVVALSIITLLMILFFGLDDLIYRKTKA